MDKALQHGYAKMVSLFIQKIPSELNITTIEIDTYFRECILYILSCREQADSDTNTEIVNQLYTEVPVVLSPEQIASKINYFQSDRNAEVTIPTFFHRILATDVAHGTRNSCEFIHVQQEIFVLYANVAVTFSFEESRRVTFLNDQLRAICDQTGITELSTRESVGVTAESVSGDRRSVEQKNADHRRLEREAEAILSSKRAGGKKDFSATFPDGKYGGQKKEPETEPPLYLAGGRKEDTTDKSGGSGLGTMKTEDLLPGKAPAWYKKNGKDKEEEQQECSDEAPTLEESLAKLDGMIGLNSVKDQVRNLIHTVRVNKWREEAGLKVPAMSLHMVFSGNPGTGKTTVARIISDIYRALGILSKKDIKEVDRSKLVGKFLGDTEVNTAQAIEDALGGVLFIDEAYALAPDGEADDYGHAAIDTILKAMEDHREELVVIVAGYDELMNDFIESNPGLKSRFAIKIKFEDYNAEELYQIFESMVRAGDDHLDERAAELAKMYFNHMYQKHDENFGNGRDVRNVYEKLFRLRSERLSRSHEGYWDAGPGTEELSTFTAEDIMKL